MNVGVKKIHRDSKGKCERKCMMLLRNSAIRYLERNTYYDYWRSSFITSFNAITSMSSGRSSQSRSQQTSMPANPFQEYVIAPGRNTKELEDVEFHREYLNRYGGVKAIDTYISLGTITGESWTSVDSSIYYTGSEL